MSPFKKVIIVVSAVLLAACTEGNEKETANNTHQNAEQNVSHSGQSQAQGDMSSATLVEDEVFDDGLFDDEAAGQDESSSSVSGSGPAADNSIPQEQDADLLAGQALYGEYCVGCHLADGSAPMGGELIACTDCNSLDALSHRIDETMPPTDTESLDAAQSREIAAYIQQTFNSDLNNSQDSGQTSNKPVIDLMSSKETAYKLAFDLAAKTPTADELNRFEQSSDQVIDGWLNSEAFYQKLMSFYNRKLKTDSYHSRFERESNYRNARDLLGSCERGMGGTCNGNSSDRELYFPAYRWWDDLPFEGVITDLTNDAIAREPLEFIRYVAKNNRPFSEILTADYALVNMYSAKSLNALNLNGSPIRSSDFKSISAPIMTELDDGVTVTKRYLVPFKEQLANINRLRGSDVQIRMGNDEDLEQFIDLYPEDPTDFIPAKIKQADLDVPLAGILTTKAFLNKYTTTPTNKQRTRANMLFNIFAATDILAIEANRDASEIDFSDSIGAVDPTKTNEDCLVCHRKLDPVADAFKNWLYNGIYKNSACQDSANINTCATSPSVGIGFEGLSAPIFGNNSVDSNSLQWLAKQVAASPLFAQSAMETLFEGFTGKTLLGLNPGASEAYQTQYQLQQALINQMIEVFNASNEDVKAATKLLVTSDYYLASEADEDLASIGSDRLLGADQLQSKFYATTRHISSTTEVDDSFRLNLGNRATWKMYGGVDGLNTHSKPNAQGGIMLTIQERLANEMACFVTAQDLYRDADKRLFMQHIRYQMPQGNTDEPEYIVNELNIRKTIQHMHLHFWHDEVSINSTEVNEVYALFLDVLTMGIAHREGGKAGRNVASHCRVDYEPDSNELLPSAQRGYRDGEYAVRAWSAVVAYFLGDFRFSHI